MAMREMASLGVASRKAEIPSLVVVDPNTGAVIDSDGISKIRQEDTSTEQRGIVSTSARPGVHAGS